METNEFTFCLGLAAVQVQYFGVSSGTGSDQGAPTITRPIHHAVGRQFRYSRPAASLPLLASTLLWEPERFNANAACRSFYVRMIDRLEL